MVISEYALRSGEVVKRPAGSLADTGPGYFDGVIDLHGHVPLHRQSGIPGKVPGALLVARGLKNCVPLLHSPVGCAFQRKINPFRPWDISFDTPCSRLTEVEAVFGGNDRLQEAIKAVAAKYQPELILVISTCVPDLIGDDFESVIKEARREVSCEVVYTTGNARRMPVGTQDALTAIIDRLVAEPDRKITAGVNICTLPAHNASFKIAELRNLLEDIGAVINGVYFIESTVEEVGKLARASLNITDYNQEWCRLAEKKFGMKSVALNQFAFLSLEEAPGSVEGTLSFLRYVAGQLQLGTGVERVLEQKEEEVTGVLRPWRELLGGRRLAMTYFLHGGAGPVLIKDLGMECGVLVVKTPGLYRTLKKQSVNQMLNQLLAFLKEYQQSEPVVLYDPSPAEEVAALKQNQIDLVLCPTMSNIAWYLQHGLKVFDEGHFVRQHARVGFNFVKQLACAVAAALKRKAGGEPLLGLLDYSADRERPHLTLPWARLVDCFQSVWFAEGKEE